MKSKQTRDNKEKRKKDEGRNEKKVRLADFRRSLNEDAPQTLGMLERRKRRIKRGDERFDKKAEWNEKEG